MKILPEEGKNDFFFIKQKKVLEKSSAQIDASRWLVKKIILYFISGAWAYDVK